MRCPNPLRILTIVLVGLAATRTSAAPVLFRLEADPSTNCEITPRDPGEKNMSMNVGDTDGDAMA
jgi:hypothetical protein